MSHEADSDSARAALAQKQADLVRALVANGPVPAGFSAKKVHLAANSLRHKRLREVALAWPALRSALGAEWVPRFQQFAQNHPPSEGGPLEDGLRFVATLTPSELTDDLRRVWLWVRLRKQCFGWAWLPQSKSLLIGFGWPGWFARVVRVFGWGV
jgi:hypothetical protein